MSENLENKICPGCGRHCDLSAPRCGRGRTYAETGVLPEHRPEEGEHHHHRERSADERLMGSLRDLGHRMRFMHEGKGGQMRILVILKEAGGMTQRALTEQLGIQPGSASEVLAKLENAGLITRTPNEADRRTADLALTEAGKAAVEQAAGERQKRHAEMFAGLSEEEKQTLLALLEKVRADWQERFPESGRSHGPRHDGHGPHHGHGPHGAGRPGHGHHHHDDGPREHGE